MKYSLALIPNVSDVNTALINVANVISVCEDLKPDYLLNDKEKLSMPHISIAQFELENTENKELLSKIWQQALKGWQEIVENNENRQGVLCNLSQKVNYKYSLEAFFTSVCWAEILIVKSKNIWIQKYHDKMLEILQPFDIKPLNASANNYNPHFTLFNCKSSLLNHSKLIRGIPYPYKQVLEIFPVRPVLGSANDQWELTAKLYDIKST